MRVIAYGCAAVAMVALAACSGIDGATSTDAAMPGAEASPAPTGTPASDASAPCSNACPDATTTVSPADAGAPDGAGDAPSAPDVAMQGEEVCHVAWPQADGLIIPSGGMRLVVDASGDAYLAVTYGSPLLSNTSSDPHPPLDLGVPSPGYATGLAIAKVDTQCHLAWMREFGAATFSESTDLEAKGLAVDADGNVTILGSFNGAVNLGPGTFDNPDSVVNDAGVAAPSGAAFLMRLDGAGHSVFVRAFRSDQPFGVAPFSMALIPDGGAAILAASEGRVDFGNGPDVDAGTLSNAQFFGYYVRFDAAGNEVSSLRTSPGDLSYDVLFSGPASGSERALWALATDAADAGAGRLLARLDPSGALTASRPLSPDDGVAITSTGGLAFFAITSSPSAFPVDESVTMESPDGATTASRSTAVDYSGGSSLDQGIVADPDGGIVVGGLFYGTIDVQPDGSFTTLPEPVGVGFQAFDSTGALTSTRAWVDPLQQTFGGVGVDPSGNVVLAGYTSAKAQWAAASVFVARLAR